MAGQDSPSSSSRPSGSRGRRSASSRSRGKSQRAFRTISEVAEQLDLPQHVLRFWETRFPQIRPLKRSGNRRYYRPEDVALLQAIRVLLHEEGLTIRGVQKRFREQGVRQTVEAVLAGRKAVGEEEASPHASPPPAPDVSAPSCAEPDAPAVSQGPSASRPPSVPSGVPFEPGGLARELPRGEAERVVHERLLRETLSALRRLRALFED